jgi:hypothetical protein
MSVVGREIVGPKYTIVCTSREVQSRTQAGGDARRGRETERKGKGNNPAVKSSSVAMSTAPGTKLAPRWCPTGLTKTHHRRVQKLRARELEEWRREEERDQWFNQE